MPEALILSIAIVISTALVCGAVALLFMGLVPRGAGPRAVADFSEPDAVFVFRDEEIVDSSDRGRQLLTSIAAASKDKRREIDDLLGYLEQHFATIRQDLRQLVTVGVLELTAQDDSGLVLRAHFTHGLTHLRLVDTRAEGSLVALDRLSFAAMRDELDTLRHVVGHVPVLAWRKDETGRITWANTAYIDAYLAVDAGQCGLTWPIPDLFDGKAPDELARLSLDMGDHLSWFAHCMVADDQGALHFATPIDLAVQTETSRREMMQVLTRAFACLPTGLALFDKDRRLQVFNPALVDLTGLDPLFLAARPSFEQVLFSLRELRMLPEPKDFGTWRREISEMERAAETGVLTEEWCLDNGRIYQVSGRPQPGGALAFFFEDVTSDATLARSLRAEIDMGQAVFDGLQDAVVTFSGAGDTLLSNARYRQLWGEDPCNDLADAGFRDALALWSTTSTSTKFWDDLSRFAFSRSEDMLLSGTVCLLDGTTLGVQARRLRQDYLMVTFRPLVQEGLRGISTSLRHAKALAAPDILDDTPAPSGLTGGAQGAVPTALTASIPRKARAVMHAGSRSR